jgi:hypothetical protein
MNWQYIVTIEIAWLGLGLIGLAIGVQLSEWAQILISKLKAIK